MHYYFCSREYQELFANWMTVGCSTCRHGGYTIPSSARMDLQKQCIVMILTKNFMNVSYKQ